MADLRITRNYEYRLRMNKAFQRRAEEVLEESRQFYNAALEHRILAYRAAKKAVSYFEQCHELTDLRQEFPDYTVTNCSIQRDALNRVDKAYKDFFRRVQSGKKAGFPRFKACDRYDSFCLPITKGLKSPLQGNKLTVSSVGTVRVRLHRQLPQDAKVKQVRVIRRVDGWYAVLSVQFPKPETKPTNQEIVGLDLGIASFATLSTGKQFTNPRFLKHAQKRISDRQKRLAFKPKRKSKHRDAAKRLLGKAHLKVKRARKHFHCNIAKDLTSRFGVIAVEKLNIKGMVKSNLAHSISDVGWGDFLSRLESKAEEAGSKVVRVNPQYTSQTCPQCGCVDALNRLTQANFKCIKCGYANHADIVGAINIRARGAVLAEQSACDNKTVRVARNKQSSKSGDPQKSDFTR